MYIDYFTKNKLIIDHAKGDGMAVIPYIGYMGIYGPKGRGVLIVLIINRLSF